jgi:hypothetical protein
LALIKQWKENWKPITFTVGEIYLIAREKGKPFQVRHVLPLGKKSHMTLDGVLSTLGSYETAKKAAGRAGAVRYCEEICLSAVRSTQGAPLSHTHTHCCIITLEN